MHSRVFFLTAIGRCRSWSRLGVSVQGGSGMEEGWSFGDVNFMFDSFIVTSFSELGSEGCSCLAVTLGSHFLAYTWSNRN